MVNKNIKVILFQFLSKVYLRSLGQWLPSDLFSYRFPVSVKGICFIDNKVVLLKNELGEWDLPGGKLKRNELIEACLIREFKEELDIVVSQPILISALRLRVSHFVPATVLVLVHYCQTNASVKDLKLSHENVSLGTFPTNNLSQLKLPQHYQNLILEAPGIQNLAKSVTR